jgi:hypothetical protein
MYLLVAYFALTFGLAQDGSEALKQLETGLGRVLLGVMALGFTAYGAWRLSEAFMDSAGHGTSAKGLAKRIGGGVSGLIHLGLSFSTCKLALGLGSDGGDSTEQGASTALGMAGGEWVLGLAAVAVVVVGLYQFVSAIKLGFLKHLDRRVAGKAWIKWAGRAGFAARGVVFVLIGIFFWRAMMTESAAQAGGMGDAIASLPATAQTVVAAGLLMFGVFSLIEARYRSINSPSRNGR